MRDLGILATVILIATSPALGCARGEAETTPLRRASTAAPALVALGTMAADAISVVIERDLTATRDECLAAQDTSRDCDDAVRYRATEYAPLIAAHSLYAELVGQYVAELQAQAGRQQRGEDVDMGDAVRLAGRVLAVYSALADTLYALGIDLPPLAPAVLASLREIGGAS